MKSWGSFGFGLAIGFVVAFVWINRDIILFGVENRDKLQSAGQVVSGLKGLFGGD